MSSVQYQLSIKLPRRNITFLKKDKSAMSCLQVCTTVHASLIIVYFSGYLGIIHLVRAQNFPKKLTFYIPWYAHLRVRIRGQKMLDFEIFDFVPWIMHYFTVSMFYNQASTGKVNINSLLVYCSNSNFSFFNCYKAK